MIARPAAAAVCAVGPLRDARPLVHCVTNTVTAAQVAGALAAVGALPIMASAAEEVEEVTRGADALYLNCGTPSEERWTAMSIAARVAAERGIPVVLDPVGVAASRWRLDRARAVAAAERPIVRGNAAEVAALAAVEIPGTARGVTVLGVPPERIEPLAADAARTLGVTVLVSGPIDAVAQGDRVRSARATAAPPDVVGLGDVLGALVAAVACVESDAFEAAWSARALLAEAIVSAAGSARGPGSFWPELLDAIGRTA